MRQPRRAELSGPGAQPLARLGVEGRLAKQTLGQRAHVESGSPDHDGLLSRGHNPAGPAPAAPADRPAPVASPRAAGSMARMGQGAPRPPAGLGGPAFGP